MREQRINYETALLAKEKAFPQMGIYGLYNIFNKKLFRTKLKQPHIQLAAPTQSLLQKWLRDKHNLWVYVSINTYPNPNNICTSIHLFINGGIKDTIYPYQVDGLTHSLTYEEALEKGLYEALKLIENG